jgi:cytochrome c peroxidase
MWERKIKTGKSERLAVLSILIFLSHVFLSTVLYRVPLARQRQEPSAVVRLGERLFRDDRFSTPSGDLPASCSNCHLFNQDPQGMRAYADFFNRSWVSSRAQDRRRLGLRNAPTIFDVADIPRLHHDGEFGSLEALVKGTLSGRTLGWLPGEESQAFDRVRAIVLNDDGAEPYRGQFRAAFGVDATTLSRDELVDFVAKAVAGYVRTLTTPKQTPYDKFIETNGLERRPAPGEDGKVFARRLLAKIQALQAKRAINYGPGFDAAALKGMKLFFTTTGARSAGNCAACHVPPLFTDNSFHNKGVSQLDYDRIHGEGTFAKLAVPDASAAVRPSARLRENPAKEKPEFADLGFWNFIDLETSPMRRAGESDDLFLRRMIATFKTPTLRNLAYTSPYFHDGSISTLEETVSQIIRLSEMARAGLIREADDELKRVRITSADVASLVAFLNALNDDLKKEY